MLIAYKYRLYPNKEQQEYFAKCFGCVRFIYNRMLSDKIDYYNETKQKLNNTPAQYKKEFPQLKEVDSLALANAQMNLQTAYNNFFKRPEVGFPKFKSKKNHKYSYTTNNQGGNIYVSDRHIKLPKIGLIRVKKHRNFDGLIKSVTVSQNPSGKYFVSVLVNQQTKLNAYSESQAYYKEKTDEAEQYQESLKALKENINSPEYIEELARDKLNMYLPNERVYIDVGTK